MAQDSTPNSSAALANLLEQKKTAEKQQIENLIQEEFLKHASILSDASKAALSTTMQDIESQMKELSSRVSKELNTPLSKEITSLKNRLESLSQSLSLIESKAQGMRNPKLWLKPAVIGMALFLGIFASTWALMHYLSSSVEANLITIKQQKQTMENLQLGGISVRDTEKGIFLILPENHKLEAGWTFSDKPALRLSKQ
jgi:hypothetical protein